MSINQTSPALNHLTLGKPTAYAEQYDATLLQAVPRALNREPLGIVADALPFHGADIWTLYELSWLNDKGLPQVAVGEVVLNANSLNLIESKSFKLYLNSFNQSRFANWATVREIMIRDLARVAGGDVEVTLLKLSEFTQQPIADFSGICIDDQDIAIEDYAFNAQWLVDGAKDAPVVSETLVSHVLKSNCLITHQPDWGSVQIRYHGPRIRRESLLRYLVSFRQHNEFHEQCVERIYTDIMRFCRPERLTVYARYTRRGGLDINPWRSNTPFVADKGRLARQ